jgi:hypothetical protein
MRRSSLLAMALISLSMHAPPSRAQNSQPAEANSHIEQSARTQIKEGCKLLPYKGDIPLSKLPFYVPDQPDLRAGVVCHYRISPDLPLFTFHFVGTPDNTLGELEVTEEPSTTIVQTIEQFTDWGMIPSVSELEKSLLTPVDANFDGYKDLQILSNCGATGNCSYDFFLYDPVTNLFVHNEFLSNNLCSPEFDAKKRRITTHSNGSVSDWENDTYQYDDGTYKPIRREISTWDRKTEKVTVNTYELRNDKMELVDSKTDPQ